jgi:hypothetical protein
MNLLDQVAKQFVFMVNNDPPPLKFAERELQICGLAEAARPTSDLGRVFVLIRDANSAKVNSSPVAVTMIFTWSDQKEPSANAVQTGFNCPSNRPRISRSCGEPRSCAGRRRLLLDASRTECPKRQSGAPKADLPLPATFGRPLCADCVDLVSDEHVLPGRDLASGRRCVWPVRFAGWCRSGSDDRWP